MIIESFKFYTTKETAEILRLSPQTISRYCREGKIKTIKNGKILITGKEIKKYMERTLKRGKYGT